MMSSIRGLLSLLILSATGLMSHAHEWEEFEPVPEIILERLVEIFEAASQADRFGEATLRDCVPHHCLEAVLLSANDDDFEWLRSSAESEIPSSDFGRLPANITYEWLFDLVPLIEMEAPTPKQRQLIDRLEIALTRWDQP